MVEQGSVMTQLSIPVIEKEREDSGVGSKLLIFELVIACDAALESLRDL